MSKVVFHVVAKSGGRGGERAVKVFEDRAEAERDAQERAQALGLVYGVKEVRW